MDGKVGYLRSSIANEARSAEFAVIIQQRSYNIENYYRIKITTPQKIRVRLPHVCSMVKYKINVWVPQVGNTAETPNPSGLLPF